MSVAEVSKGRSNVLALTPAFGDEVLNHRRDEVAVAFALVEKHHSGVQAIGARDAHAHPTRALACMKADVTAGPELKRPFEGCKKA